MKPTSLLYAIVAMIALLASAAPALATDKLDLSAGLKTLPLLNDKITDSAVMAIIFDSANMDSQAEAADLAALIDAGLEAPGGVKITARLVPVSDLGKLSGAKIGFVTKGSCSAG
jgi:thymidine phosphorylase